VEDEISKTRELDEDQSLEKHLLIEQSIQYANDLARLYQEEKERSRALEKANEEMQREISARIAAQEALKQAQQELERKVQERTQELTYANEQLKLEISQREVAEKQMKASLKEKAVLLSEVHHRVKNNLQIISSLLALQSGYVKDERVLGALSDSQSRIRSMALIHEHLYRSEDLANIDISEYARNLASNILHAYSDKAPSVSLEVRAAHVFLPVEKVFPCGLIINELVTNSLKHAFPEGRTGRILIEFSRVRDDRFILSVEDDGIGLPKDFDYKSNESLGFQLVANLAEVQLRGSLELTTNRGTVVKVEFEGLTASGERHG